MHRLLGAVPAVPRCYGDGVRRRGRASVLHEPGERAQEPQPRLGSGDADGVRASKLHPVMERTGGDVHLGRPAVARRSSVREGSASPMTCLTRPITAAARARVVSPDAFCHACARARRCPATFWVRRAGEPLGPTCCRRRSRGVGVVSAVARGGTATAAAGWRSATRASTRSWSDPPSPMTEATAPVL